MGESYGGIRSCVLLNMLLYYSRYSEEDHIFCDSALAQEIDGHLRTAFPDVDEEVVPPQIIAQQFGHQILIQPLIAGSIQEDIAARLLTAEDSPLQEVAEQKGIPIISCGGQENFWLYAFIVAANAKWDTVCYTPAVPLALKDEEYSEIVSDVDTDEADDIFTVYYKTTFADNYKETIEVYHPQYNDSGHSVSVFEPEKLFNDVKEWWYLNN